MQYLEPRAAFSAGSRFGVFGLTAALLCVGCEKESPPRESPPKSAEKSPTASILPEPLASGADRERNEKAQRGLAGTKRKKRESIPLDRALLGSTSTRVLGQALTFTVELGSLRVFERGSAHALVLEGAILPELDLEPTRQTLRLAGGDWPLPKGTELRSSADSLGWVLVWPDGRSYRTVPEGALLGLFQERRVDVMPRYDATIAPSIPQARGYTKVVESPQGRLELTLLVQPELGDSGHLLCDVLMELLRARRDPDLCGLGEFPARARYLWNGGGELTFVVSPPKRRAEGPLDEFRLPPLLPIWKPGEVPPEDVTAFPEPGPQWLIQNNYDTPLFFELPKGVGRWVAARSTSALTKTADGSDFSARDFLGKTTLRGTLKGETVVLGTPLEAGL